MTTKPATPLPPLFCTDGHINSESDAFSLFSIDDVTVYCDYRAGLNLPADDLARSIVAACNEYPKLVSDRARLVEALRALTVAHGTPNEMLTAHTQAVKDGKRLLAELGE